jgi:hypothetical protein
MSETDRLSNAAEFWRIMNGLPLAKRLEFVANVRRDHPDEPQLLELADAIERWAKAAAK